MTESTNRDRPAKRTGLAMPIRLLGQTIGVLDFYDDDRVWTEDDKALVEALADQVALAVENQRLFEQTQASLAETQALFQTSRALAAAQQTNDVWQAIIDGARQRHADACGLFVLDTEQPEAAQELILVTGWDKEHPARLRVGARLSLRDYSLCDGLNQDQPLAIPDLPHTDNIGEGSRDLLNSLGFSAGLCQPIAVRGRWFGLLIVLYQAEHTFTKAEADFYRTLADQAALAFESQRLLLETQHRAEREQLIRHITDKVRATTDLETILRTTVEEMSHALGLPRAFVRLGSAEELTASAFAHSTGNSDDMQGDRSAEER